MEDVKRNLCLIGSIIPGYTINVKDKTLISHQTWYCSMYRNFYGEGREQTYKFVEENVNVMLSNPNIFAFIFDIVKTGVLNLAETYKNSIYYDKLNELSNKIPSFNPLEVYLISKIIETISKSPPRIKNQEID